MKQGAADTDVLRMPCRVVQRFSPDSKKQAYLLQKAATKRTGYIVGLSKSRTPLYNVIIQDLFAKIKATEITTVGACKAYVAMRV